MSVAEPHHTRPDSRICSTSSRAARRARAGGVGAPAAAGGQRLAVARTAAADAAARRHPATRSRSRARSLLYLLAVVLVAVVGGIVGRARRRGRRRRSDQLLLRRAAPHVRRRRSEQGLTLVVFLIVAAWSAAPWSSPSRRARAAARGEREADTLSALAGADLDDGETLARRSSTGPRAPSRWSRSRCKARDRSDGRMGGGRAVAGWAPPGERGAAALRRRARPTTCASSAAAPRCSPRTSGCWQAFAAAAQTAYEGRRLTAEARDRRTLASRRPSAHGAARRGRPRPAHAAGRRSRPPASTLRQDDVNWTDEERAELLATIEGSTDRLELDRRRTSSTRAASRPARSPSAPGPVALDEVIGAAVLAVPDARERVDGRRPGGPAARPRRPAACRAGARQPARQRARHGPRDEPVEVSACAGSESAKLKVVDHGPGRGAGAREALFAAFDAVRPHGRWRRARPHRRARLRRGDGRRARSPTTRTAAG